jgi:ribosomal protein L12E/L44/L45/RPP1/RPP2
MFMTTAFAPDRADLEDLILDAPEMVLFCHLAAPGPEEEEDEDGNQDDDKDDDKDEDLDQDEEEDDVEALAG